MKKAGEDIKSSINTDEILLHLVTISETVRDVNGKLSQAEKYVIYLKNIITKEWRTLLNLKSTTKALLHNAMNVAQSTIRYLDSLPNEPKKGQMIDLYERLYSIMEKDSLPDEPDSTESSLPEEGDINLASLIDKIKYMESKQKSSESICWPSNHTAHKIYKSDFDEKYPESCSRESLLDLENSSTLPTVPEGAFTDFKRSQRSSSLLSIKTMKKMKLTLRQCNDENDCEEPDLNAPDLEQVNELQNPGEAKVTPTSNFTTLSEDDTTC